MPPADNSAFDPVAAAPRRHEHSCYVPNISSGGCLGDNEIFGPHVCRSIISNIVQTASVKRFNFTTSFFLFSKRHWGRYRENSFRGNSKQRKKYHQPQIPISIWNSIVKQAKKLQTYRAIHQICPLFDFIKNKFVLRICPVAKSRRIDFEELKYTVLWKTAG